MTFKDSTTIKEEVTTVEFGYYVGLCKAIVLTNFTTTGLGKPKYYDIEINSHVF